MSDIENVRSSFHDPDSRYGDEGEELESPAKDPLDSPESIKILEKLYDWWYEVRIASSDNRHEQAIDDDFVDGLQWFDEDAAVLRERHQEPLVFNEIKPAVEWVIGTEKRTRVDWNVLPRSDDDRDLAETKTKLIKYISDVNKAEFARSRAFGSAVKNGIGWLEVGIKGDTEDEPIYVRQESWRNMWLDHLSVEPDVSDARYLFRSKIIDLDIAIGLFPTRKAALTSSSEALDRLAYQTEDDFYDSQMYYNNDTSSTVSVDDALGSTHNRRDVVRLVECWYKMPAKVTICRCYESGLNGKEFDENDHEMKAGIESGHISLFDTTRMKIHCAVFVEGNSNVLLQNIPSPYKHNRFPFVPVWGYRRERDNQPYGIVRNARDPQKDLNKRRSKALFLLSVNRTVMDKGAVDDLDEYEEEVARPDAVIEKNKGYDLAIETNIQLAEEHLMLANQDGDYIRQSSGVTAENLGQESNATSGKAITARQNQGTVVTASLFDNARLTVQLSGEIILSLTEQFYTDEKVIRITGERGTNEFVTVNGFDPETGEYLNDITESQADFIVSEQDYRESVRLAMFEQMMDMISKMDSETALNMLDLVFEFSDFAGKDEMVKRIRKLNGQSDPKDPDAKAQEEALEVKRAEQADQNDKLTLREAMAKIRSLEAKAGRDEAASDESKIETLTKALEAAITAMQVPRAAAIAQDLIDSQTPQLPDAGAAVQPAVAPQQQVAVSPQ